MANNINTKSHTFFLAWFAVGLAVIVVVGGLGFLAGFNFHGLTQSYYSAGYRAAPGFFADLVTAFIAFEGRSHVLVDPTENQELLRRVRQIRVGVYRPTPNYRIPIYDALVDVEVPTGVIKPGTPSSELVRDYDVIVFPQGGYRLEQFPDGEGERLREAIGSGLGCIGICAGMIFAQRDLGIVGAEWKPLAVVGLIPVRTVPGPFWNELGGQSLRMHFAGGGYFVFNSLKRWEPLIVAENLGVVAILGQFGRGRVVVFTAHPEGGGLTLNNQSVYFSGRDLSTGPLLLRAIVGTAPKTTSETIPVRAGMDHKN